MEAPPEYDEEVLNQVGPRVPARGYYDRADLLVVGKWKLRRDSPIRRPGGCNFVGRIG